MKNLKTALPLVVITILALSILMLSSWGLAPQNSAKATQDTTQKANKKSKGAQYARRSIITFDENGVPHEEITEDFEWDGELEGMLGQGFLSEFNMPAIPDFPIVETPGLPEGLMMPPMPNGFLDLDTLDFKKFYSDGNSIEGFSDDLKVLIQDRMEGLGPELEAELEVKMEGLQEQLAKMDLAMTEQLGGLNNNLGELAMLEQSLNRLEENWNPLAGNDLDHTAWTNRMKEFETAAKKELVRDGYLGDSEKIETISWSDDEIKFNESVIKPEHEEKYRKLRSQYLDKNSQRGRPE